MAAQIKYNGTVIASPEAGQIATLKCADMKMKSDVVVEVAEQTESGGTLITVSTEEEAEDTTAIPIVNGQIIIVGV